MVKSYGGNDFVRTLVFKHQRNPMNKHIDKSQGESAIVVELKRKRPLDRCVVYSDKAERLAYDVQV